MVRQPFTLKETILDYNILFFSIFSYSNVTYNSQVHPSDSEDRFFSSYKKLNDSVESFGSGKVY